MKRIEPLCRQCGTGILLKMKLNGRGFPYRPCLISLLVRWNVFCGSASVLLGVSSR